MECLSVQNPQSRWRRSPAEGLKRGGLRNPNHESQITSRELQTTRERIGRAKPFRRKALEPSELASILPRMRQGERTNCGLWIGDCGLGTGRTGTVTCLETCLAATRRGARGNCGPRIANPESRLTVSAGLQVGHRLLGSSAGTEASGFE